MKKRLAKLVEIIAFVAVIGFSLAACDDSGGGGGGGGGNSTPKTLLITVPYTIYAHASLYGFRVGVFPVGTTLQQALDMTGLIAGCEDATAGVSVIKSGVNYIVTLPLYDISTDTRWTGSGTFDIYTVIYNYDSSDYYKASSIKILSATTSITINNSNKEK